MTIPTLYHDRINKTLLTVALLGLLLYLGKSFLIPVAIAAFFAMLLFPVMEKLQQMKFKKSLAALFAILLLLVLLISLTTVVYYQVKSLEPELPELEKKIEAKTNRLQWYLYEQTDLTQQEQEAIIADKKPDIVKALFKSLRDFVISGLSVLLFLFIVLTYTYFFLLYQHRIQAFFVQVRLFQSNAQATVMLARISQIIHNYLKGTFTVILILAGVYALGFWAIGIEHALLFALVAALMRIIPYFGSFLGIALPIAFTLLTKDSLTSAGLVLLFFMLTQLLEANLLTPYITGSRVKLNPLATIMVILLGNLLWGVAGMILFVPLAASLKTIFDQIPRLNPYSYILGKEEIKPGS